MSRKLDSPIQTQMAVSVLKSPSLSGEFNKVGGLGMKSSPVVGRSRRRVFVQTETGCVLGLELDRSDNAHTVKRKLQVALHFPTDESSLTFGDLVLKNDLTAVRNDSPLLLTRNSFHRSSSTPCLSPMRGGELHQQGGRDESGSVEILGNSVCLRQMAKDITKALKRGVEPVAVHSGLGGVYFFKNVRGESVAIVKPTDEEPFAPNNPKGFVGKALGQPGLKRSVRVGETGYREVAAYLLDKDGFARVPPTALVKISHSVFNVNGGVKGGSSKRMEKMLVSKIASLQQFVSHDYDASEHGTSSFPVSAVHRVGILDVRILNTDRHSGNLLVRKLGMFGQVELIPIDHGLSLPETMEDPYFEWIHWPQASIPFSEEEVKYIASLDPFEDCEMLRRELPMVREGSLRVLVLCTVLLKEAAAYGLCLAEIGEMMTREVRPGDEEPSEIEVVCLEAMSLIGEKDAESPRSDLGGGGGDVEFQFDLDCEEALFALGNARSHLPKVEEEEEDDEEEEEEEEEGKEKVEKMQAITKLSMSLKSTLLGEKSQKYQKHPGGRAESAYASSGHRSAEEQIPASTSFVKLSVMSEEEWTVFLEKYQELLYPAFAKRKAITLGQNLRQRMGTSCQF
ncbi:Phosphatidylinositol 4-kinase gamma 5 [Raphanus sativus]|uniref:1-phosphatidylinositol 4-kinase n=1 Tax=Raphanus sativus TaxID=3726 RepID=A0A9W3C8N4_RAPSA|nr:phosphatidylinositol 4-kinase gamma 5 [Raphanus sativus]KAJ4879752.1 Phosphatidylinositol 4-kinase gamma 5 [Raphanus sativus]